MIIKTTPDKKVKNTNLAKGFTLLEVIFYVLGTLLVLSVLSFSIIHMYRFYKDLTIVPRADRIGTNLVDRIVKDIRTGKSVDLSASELEIPTGSITINSIENSTDLIKYFQLNSGRIIYQENGGTIEYLSPNDMSVSKLYLTQILTPISQAIRVEIQITFERAGEQIIRTYSGISILRRTYE
jgi:hypothetical protein